MIYGSVCSGIEAATQAWHPLGWTPAFFSEIEKFPSAVLAHRYGSNMPDDQKQINGVPNYGDMTEFKEWPNHAIDVLVGGTPCQSFSVAGLRKGLDDPRGNLMLTFGAIAQRYKPKWIIWENVPGVLSSNKGRDFGAFLRLLGECGYGFAYRVLDAQYVRVDGFGRAVPQRRRRVFVIGCLGDWRPPAAVLFEPESLFGHPPTRRKAGQTVAGTPDASVECSGRSESNPGAVTCYRPASHGGYAEGGGTLRANGGDLGGGSETLVTNSGDKSFYLNAGGMGRQDAETETLIAFNSREDTEVTHDRTGPLTSGTPQAQAVAFAQNSRDEVRFLNGDGQIAGALAAESGMKQQTYLAQSDPIATHDVAGTMISRQTSGGFSNSIDHAAAGYMALDQNWAVRRLTPTECERLMGFPDGFTQIPWRNRPAQECPDGHRYKALGNSMAVNCMRWIGRRIQMMEALI